MPELSPEQIIRAIAITTATIKVITDGASHLHPADAATMVLRYPNEWTAKLRKNGQVKWIRKSVTIRAPWQHCYRTAEAPALQPSIEWLRSRRDQVNVQCS